MATALCRRMWLHLAVMGEGQGQVPGWWAGHRLVPSCMVQALRWPTDKRSMQSVRRLTMPTMQWPSRSCQLATTWPVKA